MFQFVGCIFITNDDSMGMHLQATDSPHVVDSLFNTMTKGTGFVMAIDHNHHLLGIHHSTDTYSQGGLGNQIYVVVKETAVGYDGICGQCLLPGTALQGWSLAR